MMIGRNFAAALGSAAKYCNRHRWIPSGDLKSSQVTTTSDEQIDAFIRDNAESAYHPCGTVRMGAADNPGAVVDPECRVIGVDGLRAADSSIFPRITNGNLNAPSIMTGEKAADHILGRQPWRGPMMFPLLIQIGKPARGESLVVMRSV